MGDYVFAARAGHDRVLTLGTFAWITGQSYMLYGPALAGCASILVEGSLLGGDGLRWARVALATKATILKCAAAFVRQAMADPERRAARRARTGPTRSAGRCRGRRRPSRARASA